MRAILLPIFVTVQLFIGCMGLCQAASNDNMRLFGRSLVTGYQVDLSEADQRWLTDKRVLRIGVSLPDYPPLDIIANNRDYEGITADYASLLEQLLGVRVEVKGYLSRREAIEALKLGEIDLFELVAEAEGAGIGVELVAAAGFKRVVVALFCLF